MSNFSGNCRRKIKVSKADLRFQGISYKRLIDYMYSFVWSLIREWRGWIGLRCLGTFTKGMGKFQVFTVNIVFNTYCIHVISYLHLAPSMCTYHKIVYRLVEVLIYCVLKITFLILALASYLACITFLDSRFALLSLYHRVVQFYSYLGETSYWMHVEFYYDSNIQNNHFIY